MRGADDSSRGIPSECDVYECDGEHFTKQYYKSSLRIKNHL